MKKLIALTLALALCLGLGVTALAEDKTITQEDASGTTDVQLNLLNGTGTDNTYVVTIPATVSVPIWDWDTEEWVDGEEEAELVVSATAVKVLSGRCLEVFVSSANDYYLVNTLDSESQIAYYVYVDSGIRDADMDDDDEPEISYDEISGHTDMQSLPQGAQSLLSASGDDDDDASGDDDASYCVLTVFGQGWYGEAASGNESLWISTDVEEVNGATAPGKHSDTLTFTCKIENAGSAESAIRDADMA